MRTVPLALIIFFALTTSASAKLTTDEQRVAAFTPIAASEYPSACVGHVVFTTNPNDGIVRDGAAYTDGSCRIYIRPGLSDIRFCVTLVHEYGHLAGHGHEPTGPMQEHGDGTYRPCLDAVNASVTDYDRVLMLIPGKLASIKAVRRGTKAYRAGIRWIVWTQGHKRWLIEGTGTGMSATLDTEQASR